MVATENVASRPEMRMRSQFSDEEICRGMRESGVVPVLRTVTIVACCKLLGCRVEAYVEIEAGDGDGLAIGVFK